MSEQFKDARLKIERAQKHISNLEDRLRLFDQTDSYTIRVHYDADAGCDFLKIETTQTVDEDLVLIVGDALNNLRSALDYIMLPFVLQVTKYTKFPICRDEQEFEAAINGGLKRNSTNDFRRILQSGIQPYGGGNGHPLFPLHELNIVDKHNLLIAKVQITLVRNICGIDETGAKFFLPDWLIVYPFIASHKCVGFRNIKITDKGQASCGIVFGKGMPLQGRKILAELRTMLETVYNTVETLASLYAQGLR